MNLAIDFAKDTKEEIISKVSISVPEPWRITGIDVLRRTVTIGKYLYSQVDEMTCSIVLTPEGIISPTWIKNCIARYEKKIPSPSHVDLQEVVDSLVQKIYSFETPTYTPPSKISDKEHAQRMAAYLIEAIECNLDEDKMREAYFFTHIEKDKPLQEFLF